MIASESDLLRAGVAAHHGSGKQESSGGAAIELVAKALKGIDLDRLPVRGAILLATADWCRAPHSLPKEVRIELRKWVGYEVPLIGGSMPKIFCSTDPEPFIEEGMALILLCSRDIWMSVDCLKAPYGDTPETRRKRVRELAGSILAARTERMGLGTSAEGDLVAIFPGHVVDKDGQRLYLDNELHADVLAAFDHEFNVFGASAADGLRSITGFQFANDECLESGLAVALLENDLKAGTSMQHGFVPVDRVPRVSVDGIAGDPHRGYLVSKLDGVSAGKRLQELMKEIHFTLDRPVFGLASGPDYEIVLPLDMPSGEEKPVRFTRQMTVGDSLYILNSTTEQMSHAGRRTLNRAITTTGANRNAARLLAGFACTGRFKQYDALDASWKDSITQVAKDYPDVPMVCALCAGEFAEDEWRRPRSNNFSIWMSCLTGEPNSRAKNRFLQTKLLKAAQKLLTRSTPREVMQAALEGAADSGAEGGQICIVEESLGKILGGHNGCAYNKPGSAQDFEAVIKTTFRDTPPDGKSFRLPPEIHNWAPGLEDKGNEAETPDFEENILSILVSLKHPIFIPDSTKTCFHCNQRGVRDGRLEAQFIMALVGSSGHAIATMQIGFQEGHVMDRESFGLWQGYGQKVTSAFERAQELEERSIMQKFTKLGNDLMQEPVAGDPVPEQQLERYIDKVRTLLGSDYVHMRVRRLGSDDKQFALVAPVGSLAELHRKVRPTLEEGHGSCRMDVLGPGGRFTNTQEETRKFYEGVNRVTNEANEYLTKWEEESEKVKSAAILPLRDKGKIFGSLVIDSYSEYFFTERCQRIAQAAAIQAAALLAKKEADFVRSRNEQQLKEIATVALFGVKAIHDIMRPLANIQRKIDLLRGTGLSNSGRIAAYTAIEKNKEDAIQQIQAAAKVPDPQDEEISLHKLVQDALGTLANEGVSPKVISRSGTKARVRVNYLIKLALKNLLSNAVEEAEAAGEVSVSLEESGGFGVIRIQNSGRELSVDEVSRFFTIGNSTKNKDHLGLGLPFAQHAIKAAGGQIRLDPAQGGGLVAEVMLPSVQLGKE